MCRKPETTRPMNTKIRELTRGEEEIMQILWRLGDAVVNDIIARTDEPHGIKFAVKHFFQNHASTSLRQKSSQTE